ncbi:MAG: Cyclic di-GMP phosphodiesterase CdgJ [Gemmatimonadaceae bacterium]|nr:Cyclic di-GMP phosphodiesterase CdgJ [Gemmatimonadaceae bacterium]
MSRATPVDTHPSPEFPTAPMSSFGLVRQPIFDRKEAAIGYELRFRDPEDGSDPFARSYLSGSYDIFRSGLPAFVRVTREQLLAGVCKAPDPRTVVVLLPPDLQPDEEVLKSLSELTATGVVLGLDDFRLPTGAGSPVLPLLAQAKWVRLDLRSYDPAVLRQLVAALKRQGKSAIADHVLDSSAHSDCVTMGFEAFQGSHFSRPESLPQAEIPTSTATAIRLLALSRDANTSERELERVVSGDPGITFQLLRIVNSAAIGGQGISSILHALRLVGRNNLVRWLALASYTARTGKSGVDDELIRQAVQRAHLAEALARFGPRKDSGAAFLVGLFSLLDAVFRMPLRDVLDRVNLAEEVRSALLDREGIYSDLLQVIESYELGMWELAAEQSIAAGIPADQLAELYAESLRWAEEQIPTPKTRLPKAG